MISLRPEVKERLNKGLADRACWKQVDLTFSFFHICSRCKINSIKTVFLYGPVKNVSHNFSILTQEQFIPQGSVVRRPISA